METEETVKEECVAVSKTKRIWLAFVDIVLFTVLFVIFLFLFAIPFAIAFPELKTQAGGMSVYLMMLNEALMLASGLIAACMVLGFRKLPFSGLGLSLKGWGRSLLNGALFVVFLYAVGFGLSLLLGAVEVACCFSYLFRARCCGNHSLVLMLQWLSPLLFLLHSCFLPAALLLQLR